MVTSGNTDDGVYKRHQELCAQLNLDRDAVEESWNQYENIRQNYSLEGDNIHWLACAVYVASRKSKPPASQSDEVKGNCVSLTKLLRLSKLSLLQFFNKCKKWVDMANLPASFHDNVNRLEQNFAVSMVIFEKFQPIFKDMFQEPGSDQIPTSRRRQRNQPCTPAHVFGLTWTLFISIKVEYPIVSDDLVNSYHMLLACCDLMFANALLADRRDLLNPTFSGLPSNFSSADYKPPKEAPCIIDKLIEKHDGISLEAKGIKVYCWQKHLTKLFDQKILKGEPETFSGLLDLSNFESNFKAINRLYEEHVLSVGNFDERIFLAEIKRLRACKERNHINPPSRPVLRVRNVEGDEANQDIGTPTRTMGDFDEKMQAKKSSTVGKQWNVPTPLTGRRYLKGIRETTEDITPLSTATQSVSRLQALLAGRSDAPSEKLLEFFRSCSRDPKEKVLEIVDTMSQKFCEQYSQQGPDHESNPNTNMDFAQKRLQLGKKLYYKILENILVDERKQKPDHDFSNLLEQEIFHQSLLACCLEIVIFSYNSPQRTFPWILEALDIEPFYFYKVIEPLVRSEDHLSRDTVKHLSLIEEKILESMVWRSQSPLWDSIALSGLPVPSCEEVSLRSQLTSESDNTQQASIPVLKRLSGSASAGASLLNSPVSSMTERFQSPVATGVAKKLFDSEVVTIKPGQSILQNKALSIQIAGLKGEGGQYIPITFGTPTAGGVIISGQPTVSAGSVIKTRTPTSNNPSAATNPDAANNDSTAERRDEDSRRRTTSLGLFFRKFYHLGSERMQELCTQLDLTNLELKQKIWTCFEHTIIYNTDLMRDRHIDQMLMCSVYVICKITKNDRTFQDIMKCYRTQPQASSHVYRSVLLESKSPSDSGNNADNQDQQDQNTAPSRTPHTPSRPAGTSNTFEHEERGDLIKFYNTVYVTKVQSFAMKFSAEAQSNQLTLSPLPVCKSQPMSPRRRVSEKHSVYISSLHPQEVNVSPTKLLDYKFSRSPARDLRAINNMIQVDSRKVGKRLLADDGAEDSVPPKIPATDAVTRKLHNIIGDRLGQT